jgi:hypothetical protein
MEAIMKDKSQSCAILENDLKIAKGELLQLTAAIIASYSYRSLRLMYGPLPLR